MCLVFCLIGGCLGFKCILLFISLLVGFVLTSFSKIAKIPSFSDWLVVVVVFSLFRFVQWSSRNQSIPSSGFMSSQSLVRIVKFFLIPLALASTVIFPANFTSFLLTSWYFFVIGGIYLFFINSLSRRIIVTADPVSTLNFFYAPPVFTVEVMWLSCWTFMNRISICRIAITAVSFFCSLFCSCSVFAWLVFLCIGSSLIFFLGSILVLLV